MKVYKLLVKAERGNASAQYDLSICYGSGLGVTQDYQEAVRWLIKAAEQGHAQAQYSFGLCYGKGQGVTQDYQEAVRWFTKAAKQGHVQAQNILSIYANNFKTN
jgi:TPR repeat protein